MRHALVPDAQPTLLISPCSSHAARDWRAERYAAIAAHAVQSHGMRVILCGGRSERERAMGAQIERHCEAGLINQIGRDTLPQLLALLARSTVLLSPDAGPVHMATMVGTPVIGLYACDPLARAAARISRASGASTVTSAAAQRFRGRSAAQLPWQEKIEQPGRHGSDRGRRRCASDSMHAACATIDAA